MTTEVKLVKRTPDDQRRRLVKEMADVDLSKVDAKHPIEYDRVLRWVSQAMLIEQQDPS